MSCWVSFSVHVWLPNRISLLHNVDFDIQVSAKLYNEILENCWLCMEEITTQAVSVPGSQPVLWWDKKTALNGDWVGYYRKIFYWPTCFVSPHCSSNVCCLSCWIRSVLQGSERQRSPPPELRKNVGISSPSVLQRSQQIQPNPTIYHSGWTVGKSDYDNTTTKMVRFVFIVMHCVFSCSRVGWALTTKRIDLLLVFIRH